MKNVFFSAVAILLLAISVEAQTTVDSIAAKYKLVPMPDALTMEKTFPVLGSYELTTPQPAANTTATTTTSTTTTGTDASTASATSMNTLTVSLDSVNKGMVWVEGLPQGKFKAFLKKSPATYRIMAQKAEGGKQIPEGTLLFDPATQTLHIALGKAFDDMDPAAIFAMSSAATSTDNTVQVKVKTPTSKSKSKVTFYTATKVGGMNNTTEDANQATEQDQPTDSTQQQSQDTPSQQ